MEAMYNFPPRVAAPPQTRRFNPQIGAKKLVVKNIKTSQWDSKAYLAKIWDQLDVAIDQIFQAQSVSKEELYRGVENVCRQGSASTLYNRLEAKCRAHVQTIRPTSLEDTIAVWTTWKEQMSTIHAIFYFLDRSYLLSSSKPTISELVPKLFREIVNKDVVIEEALVLMTSVRQQYYTSAEPQPLPELFNQAVLMFHELSLYADFEQQFLTQSTAFAKDWAQQSMALPDYIRAANILIATELGRQLSTSLLSILDQSLIEEKLDDLTDISQLLDANDLANLTALYELLQRRNLGSRLRPPFEKWVNTTGTAIVLGDSDDMVPELLVLQRRLDIMWKQAFQKDESIGHGLRESFEIFMNKTKKGDATWGTDNTKVGEMIAKYVDTLLRGGLKAIAGDNDENMNDDAELNAQLDQALDLFRYVHGKAVFEAFYKKDLARRLLMARSASADAERSMLTRLKTECGSGFTQNLEQMFKDIELSREEMQSYKQRLEDRGSTSLLSMNILSAAAWPSYPDIPVIIPAEVKRAIDDFELHYKHKHTGRKLDWKHALAHCQMKAAFPGGSKELVVSSFQAIILLLFNSGETLSYQHVLSESGLPEAEVKRTLQSLACAKLQPLTKMPKGREINETDTFKINDEFKHPKYRVKINQIQLKETKQENKETHMRVAEDRNFECQAAIVRIMKSRKTIGHSELVSEVIKATMTRGVLAVADIKKNIDRLIEKDYMEREDGGGYSYVA